MMTQTNEDLKLTSYDYELPEHMIAERPVVPRHDSRLLVYNKETDEVIHTRFLELDRYLPKDSLLVLNETKVFPARMLGHKISGGKCEVFLLSPLPVGGSYTALIKTASRKNVGDEYYFDFSLNDDELRDCDVFKGPMKREKLMARITRINGDNTFGVAFNGKNMDKVINEFGKVPIPPYVRRGNSDGADISDYQTIYARGEGSVAAPTAGFHFTNDVFARLDKKGIDRAFVTLHIGLGTFALVKSENILEHKMHREEYCVTRENLEMIRNRKIIAVGTTTLRVLESAIDEKNEFSIVPDKYYSTDIFIHPGVDVRSVSGLVTNFHLPKSTLLMLVSGLIGRKKALALYEDAKREGYRFFSYGDAMLILLERGAV
ncbi:MAG: tRNA preQ1(34) S-adenosylmethionine ribosyltransferase-isomerase QueA [Bacteriovoracaceae bacterium]|nr:tRNA preQ1(34) S-adenosylmethionine ribosyltransferase-isomerase QueA [Bacteriovoracaceae bacterium]